MRLGSFWQKGTNRLRKARITRFGKMRFRKNICKSMILSRGIKIRLICISKDI